MPDEKTQFDSLWWWLSGAASDGAAQADPDESLGLYRSSTEAEHLDMTITNPFSNISIDFAPGINGTGSGSLAGDGANAVRYTAPGGSAGAWVTILNGETKIAVSGGGESQKYVRISRTDTDNLTGTATIVFATIFNNVLGANNLTSAWATAGRDSIRAYIVRNEASKEIKDLKIWVKTIGTARVSDGGQLGASGAGTVVTTGSLADWEDTGYCRIVDNLGALREIVYYESRTDTTLTVPAAGRSALGTSEEAGAGTDDIYCVPGIRLGKEAPSEQPDGFIEDETGDETGIPGGGAPWITGISETDGLEIGDLESGEIYGVWIRRTAPAGVLADPDVLHSIGYSYEAA